ncbi:MAG: hypothetical protein MUE44_12420 [Oscillatoriaceae cyanobacterium Prado104]|nr:hypothetical protein [Oscillatoriaceae cyanobacterium Prado104]
MHCLSFFRRIGDWLFDRTQTPRKKSIWYGRSEAGRRGWWEVTAVLRFLQIQAEQVKLDRTQPL